MFRIGGGLPGAWVWFCLGMPMCGLQAMAQRMAPTGWIISAVHADPTPSVGAPEAEFVALYLVGEDSAACRSTQGLTLHWNGHERELPAGSCHPVGTAVLVHREADSAAFLGLLDSRVALPSWPALVNGGTVVELRDSVGRTLDAVTYAESDLGGGGRPWMRMNPRGCGADPNMRLWSSLDGPSFGPTGESPLEWSLPDADRLERSQGFPNGLPRGPGQWEWRLGVAVDPASRSRATATVTAEASTTGVEWASDSVVTVRWNGRLESQAELGDPVLRLGPIRGCRPDADWQHLHQTLVRLPSHGQVEPVSLLVDPHPADPLHPEEFVTLVNLSDHPVDPSSWDWDGGQTMRRRVLEPGAEVRFSASRIENWPTLSNAGGHVHVLGDQGQPVVSWSWSPCDHSADRLAGRGLPLERTPGAEGDWHTAGSPMPGEPWGVIAHGCLRDWSGEVSAIQLHGNRSVAPLGPRWGRWVSSGVETEWQGLDPGPDPGGRTFEVPVPPDLRTAVVWPWGARFEWAADTATEKGASQWLTCPQVPSGEAPSVRIDEVLWNASEDGGEYVELRNAGLEPLDLMGLQASTVRAPLPSDWDSWMAEGLSVVLRPGEVMAFGMCPRWYGAPFSRRGPARWPAEEWSALGNSGGHLAIRLPAHGTDILDSITWQGEQGPWWWEAEDWAWARGQDGWEAMPDRGSPGRPNFWTAGPCPDSESGVRVHLDGGWPVVDWSFSEAGHRVSMGVVSWPQGELWRTGDSGTDSRSGRWTWNGLDGAGLPVRPGSAVLDVRWHGPVCRGRKRLRIRVPGFGE